MERITNSTLAAFLAKRPYSVVHVDADWDGYRKAVSDKMAEAEERLGQSVSFGYVDCDDQQDYARDINVLNVPSVVYYRAENLIGIIIGMRQDIEGSIERMMRGESLNETNTLSRG